jgi:hypothetical protein
MVFGPDSSYEQFVEDAHASLVRYPSDEAYFELARDGYLGAIRSQPVSIFGRLLAIAMRDGEGACGEIVRRINSLSQIY